MTNCLDLIKLRTLAPGKVAIPTVLTKFMVTPSFIHLWGRRYGFLILKLAA